MWVHKNNKRQWAEYMAERIKKNAQKPYDELAQSTKYHERLTELKLRVLAPSEEVPDYLTILRERAKEQGFITTKGKTKGEGNVNEYILRLIEADMNGYISVPLAEIERDKFQIIRQADLTEQTKKKRNEAQEGD